MTIVCAAAFRVDGKSKVLAIGDTRVTLDGLADRPWTDFFPKQVELTPSTLVCMAGSTLMGTTAVNALRPFLRRMSDQEEIDIWRAAGTMYTFVPQIFRSVLAAGVPVRPSELLVLGFGTNGAPGLFRMKMGAQAVCVARLRREAGVVERMPPRLPGVYAGYTPVDDSAVVAIGDELGRYVCYRAFEESGSLLEEKISALMSVIRDHIIHSGRKSVGGGMNLAYMNHPANNAFHYPVHEVDGEAFCMGFPTEQFRMRFKEDSKLEWDYLPERFAEYEREFEDAKTQGNDPWTNVTLSPEVVVAVSGWDHRVRRWHNGGAGFGERPDYFRSES